MVDNNNSDKESEPQAEDSTGPVIDSISGKPDGFEIDTETDSSACSSPGEPIAEGNEMDDQTPFPGGNPFGKDDPVEFIPPAAEEQRHKPKKRVKRKKEFNPWTELDKASKKNVSRRDLITGLFRFLPRDEDKKK